MSDHAEVKVGQVWRDKRESWRTVEIIRVHEPDLAAYGRMRRRGYVEVTRNTSSRTQSILLSTLRAKYRLAAGTSR